MNLNRIMDNIYGDSSSQSFDGVSLTGGHVEHRRARIRYIDEPAASNSRVPSYSELSSKANKIYDYMNDDDSFGFSISGGGVSNPTHASSAKSETVLASMDFVDDEDAKLFIKEFHLHYLVNNAHNNSIYVIPTSATLKKLVSDLKAKLKEENIEPYTDQAGKYISTSDLPFKNYIFDVYGKDSKNNEGFDYQVTSDFPNTGMSTVLRRKNRLSIPYFFKFASKDDIKVSTNSKMSNPKSLEFVAKCARDCFILRGDIPPATDSGKKSNVVTPTLSGGAKANNLRSLFKSFVRKYDGDIDQAAYDFVSTVALSEAENTGDIDQAAAHMAKAYSSDFVHSAFSVLAADDYDPVNIDDGEYDTKDIDEMHEAIISAYQPKSMNINLDHAKSAIKAAYLRSKSAKTGMEASKMMVSDMMRMYGKYPVSMFKADLATALVKRNQSEDTIDYAFDMMDAIDAANSSTPTPSLAGGSLDSQMTFDDGVSSGLTNAIYSAFSASPFIGVNARGYTPMLLNKSRKRKRVMKKRFSNQAFEDNNTTVDSEKPFEFQLIEEDEGTVEAPPTMEGGDEGDGDEVFDAFY